MLNKFIFSIFLMIGSFFVNPLRAMEDPNRNRNLEQDIQKQDSKKNGLSKTIAGSLKDIIVKMVGLEVICALPQGVLPEELREHGIKFLINEHCAPLEVFKEKKEYSLWLYTFIKITEEDLQNYKKLLYELCENQFEGIDLLLTGFSKCWFWPPIFVNRTLNEICEFLKILIRHNDLEITLSDVEIVCRDKLFGYILETKNIELFKLLLNKGLLPRLDYKIKINGGFVCSFFKRLIYCKSSYFFENVVQKEKDKDYDWKKLFDQEEAFIFGGVELMPNIMIIAAGSCEQNIFKNLLALAREKGLLDINIKEEGPYGWTMLMIAVNDYNVELVKLLLENGADINMKCNNGKTALGYAKDCLDGMNINLAQANLHNNNRQSYEKARLSASKIVDILIEYGAVPDLVPQEFSFSV